jgi:drug/metabolite transporter (DMT)-like permease
LKESVKVVLVFSAICLIWGSTWLGIKASLESLSPMFSAGFRFILASIIIFTLIKIKQIKLQTNKLAVILYFIMGFFSFIIPFGLVYWGQQYVPSGLASVLFAVYPFFVLLFSYLAIPGERIGVLRTLGIVIGFTGILIIFSDQLGGDISSYLIGMTAIVASGIMQAGVAVTLKKYGHNLNPLSMNFIPMLIAGIGMTLIGFITEDFSKLIFDLNAVISVLYLAAFGSVVTFTSYYWLLKRINVVMLSLLAFITPIVALFLGWLVYNEQLSTQHFLGSLLVLTGLLWANLGNVKKLKNFRILNRNKPESNYG